MKKIFISYSHRDEKWKERLVTHLKVLELEGRCQLWHDRNIQAGTDWSPEIENQLNEADIAIMMISTDFLTSKFIREKEIPGIMERRNREGLKVVPVIVKPCNWEKLTWLASIQVVPKDGVPLTGGNDYDIEKKLVEISDKIHDIIFEEPLAAPSPSIRGPGKGTILLTGLPQRKIDLIGRQEDLQLLEKRLKETDRVLLVNGLGGIGKTEVCKRFFMEHYKEFAFAGWFDYVSSIKESIVNGFLENIIKVSEKDTLDQRFFKIMDFLKKPGGDVLLVMDNIENPKDEHLDTLTALPVNFKVIANSRLHLEGFEVHTLDFLTPDCCRALFYRFYKGERDDTYVEKIVERCGFHTLTLELLARTAQNAALPVKDLYEQLEVKGFNLNDVIGDKVHTFWHNQKERKRFFDHLAMIFDLTGVTGAELNILVNLSVLPPIYISISDFSEWMKLEDKEAVNSLVRKGWLRRDKFSIFMHQVIQEVIRYQAAPGAGKCENLIDSLKWKLYLEPGDNPINKREFVIFADSLVRHIDENEKELATLANNLSTIYKALGQLEPALEFQKKAIKIWEKALDKDHPHLAAAYNNLSTIYKALGQLEPALEFQKKAIKIGEKALDKDHPNLAAAYNNLSIIYQSLGQLEPALEFQKKAIKILEKALDKDHPLLATAYNNLSTIYQDLGQLEPALEFQLKDIEICEKILDKQHPDLANSYHNLSTIYFAMEDYGAAKSYAEQAAAILQHLFPNGHPHLDLYTKNLEKIKRHL